MPVPADGGTRTRTTLSGQRILSPLRLPFRHIGLRADPQSTQFGPLRKPDRGTPGQAVLSLTWMASSAGRLESAG
jgi:hypothetical protein